MIHYYSCSHADSLQINRVMLSCLIVFKKACSKLEEAINVQKLLVHKFRTAATAIATYCGYTIRLSEFLYYGAQ